jgi:LuxR family maltose regulon positive regulatory protein
MLTLSGRRKWSEESLTQLIATKLSPPRLRAGRVPRPHLHARLAARDGVVLVSAPPGFGKSTFVVEWLESQQRPYAWYSLDRFDSDVGVFGAYLTATVSALTGRASGLEAVPGEPAPDVRALVSTLVDDLATAPPGAVIVLDDYHVIEGGAVHEAVAYLVDRLPPRTGLVLITRADPPLPSARLRAQRRLTDVRGADLRFSRDEVGEYLCLALGTQLPDDAVTAVAERSEGWIAALQLVTLGLDPADSDSIVAAMSGEHRHIAGYLIEEVLARLPAELSAFLLDTCPFDRFDASLCRAVGAADAPAELIDALEQRNAFLIPLEDGWFRYHHLFAELLRSRLRRSDPDHETALLVAAARACDERGLADDAVDHALRSGDLALAADVVERHSRPLLAAGGVATLRSWLSRFPADAGPAATAVTLASSWCRIFEGDSQAARLLIDRIAAGRREDARAIAGELDIMRAIAAFQDGDAHAAERRARRGLARRPLPARSVECLGHLYVGRSLYARSLWDDARVHLRRAAALADRSTAFWAVTALFWLGATDTDDGDLVAGERSMLRAQEVSTDTEIVAAAGIADTGLAFIRLNQLRAVEAIDLAERGTRRLERTTFTEMVFRAYFVWSEALSLAERFDESHAVAEEGIR